MNLWELLNYRNLAIIIISFKYIRIYLKKKIYDDIEILLLFSINLNLCKYYNNIFRFI